MSPRILHQWPDPPVERAWRDLLKRATRPSHYCTPEYFREPPRPGYRPFAVLVSRRDSGTASGNEAEFTGVLTGVVHDRRIHSGLEVSPQTTLTQDADTGEDVHRLIDGLLAVAGHTELITVHVWERHPAWIARGFGEQICAGTVVLDLRPGPDALFAKCSDRAAIRASRRAGLEVREATDDDIPLYYQILADWSRHKQLPCFPLDYYRQAFGLRGNRRLFVATNKGELIAGSVIRFCPGGLVEYAANSSSPQHQRLRPNDLLLWSAIEWSCSQGFTTFSMGGTHHFLTKFGGQIVPTFRYRLDRSWMRRHDLRDAALAHARRIFKRLPASWQARLRQRNPS